MKQKPTKQLTLPGTRGKSEIMSHKADADADESVAKTKVGQKGRSPRSRLDALESAVLEVMDFLMSEPSIRDDFLEITPAGRARFLSRRARVSQDAYDTGWYDVEDHNA